MMTQTVLMGMAEPLRIHAMRSKRVMKVTGLALVYFFSDGPVVSDLTQVFLELFGTKSFSCFADLITQMNVFMKV